MSDNSMDSGQLDNGNEGSPNPKFQESTDAKPNSSTSDSGTLREQVEGLLKELGYDDIDERVKRTVQSTKDRRFAQQEKLAGRVGELETQLEQYNRYKEGGASHQEALRQMQIDELLSGQKTTPENTSTVQFGKPDDWYVQTQSYMLKAAGVPENDADVLQYARSRTFNNAEEYLSGLQALIEQKRTGSPTDGALNMGGGQSAVSPGGKLDTLRQSYEERLAKVPRGNAKALSDLKSEYRRLGYDRNTDPKYQPDNRRR